MAEKKMNRFVFNEDGKTYVMTGSSLDDICAGMGITEDRLYELLSRDAYCPTLSAAPSMSTLTYIDTDGSTNHFHVGQLCRWAEDNGYRMAVCTGISDTESSWQTLPLKLSELEDDMGYVTDDELSAKGYATTAELSAKQDKISDLETIRENAAKGATALQSVPYVNTTTDGLMYATDKTKLDGIASGAEVNVQSDWSVSDDSSDAFIKNKPTLSKVATSNSYSDLDNLPTIPSEVTETTVSGWGFTKNTGTYSKPSTGIPKTDLSSDVQTTLGKADTALQSYTETDPTVPSWAKATSKPTYTAAEVGALPATTTIPSKVSELTNDSGYTTNTGTITGITMNGSSKGTSGTVNLGYVITGDGTILKMIAVDALPSSPVSTTLYIIPE